MNHFYLTLPSDSSFKSYPDNTVARFVTKLPDRVRLDGDYEVGLSELIYPHSWFNVDNSRKKFWIGVGHPLSTDLQEYYIKSSFYEDSATFARDLTEQAAKAFAKIPELSVKFLFDTSNSRFSIEIISTTSNYLLYVSEELQQFLGFTGRWTATGNPLMIADKAFDLHRGLRLMYIYCDIVSHRIVGDTKAPLLRVCNVNGKSGDMVRTIFDHPHYLPIARREFDTIEININTELGSPMPFTFGKSVVTLHFRRRHSLLAAS